MARTNKDKSTYPVIKEILDAPIPGEPVKPEVPTVESLLAKDPADLTAADMDVLSDNKDDLTDEQKVRVGLEDPEVLPDPETALVVPEPPKPIEPAPVVPVEETQEEKDRRYKAQQAEAQILAERNKQIAQKVDEAAQLKEPTEDELTAFVRQD